MMNVDQVNFSCKNFIKIDQIRDSRFKYLKISMFWLIRTLGVRYWKYRGRIRNLFFVHHFDLVVMKMNVYMWVCADFSYFFQIFHTLLTFLFYCAHVDVISLYEKLSLCYPMYVNVKNCNFSLSIEFMIFIIILFMFWRHNWLFLFRLCRIQVY